MTNLLRLTALLGALAVAVGAFGAHGLKAIVGPEELVTFNTGVRYHFYHVLAMAVATVLHFAAGIELLGQRPRLKTQWLTRAVYAWATGIILFSGSLYLLTLQTQVGIPASVLGPITPIGGLFFIVGWVFLFLAPSNKSLT